MSCQKWLIYQQESVRLHVIRQCNHMIDVRSSVGHYFLFIWIIFFQLKDSCQASVYLFQFDSLCEVVIKGPYVLFKTFYGRCCTDLFPFFQCSILQSMTSPPHPFCWTGYSIIWARGLRSPPATITPNTDSKEGQHTGFAPFSLSLSLHACTSV